MNYDHEHMNPHLISNLGSSLTIGLLNFKLNNVGTEGILIK